MRPISPNTRVPTLGFTLVEMVTVLTLIGLITGIAVPLFSSGRWKVDSAVQEVMMSLNAAQRLAVLRQHDLVVTFITGERKLRVHQDVNNNGVIDAGEDIRVVDLPETVGFGLGSAPALGAGSDPVTFRVVHGNPRLVFHRNGSASESGAAYLRPLEGSMSADPEAVRAVLVERATGEIRCYSYHTTTWEASC